MKMNNNNKDEFKRGIIDQPVHFVDVKTELFDYLPRKEHKQIKDVIDRYIKKSSNPKVFMISSKKKD